ncbi:MAG: cobalamin-dependent protein [Desulforhopalus sp.]|nr:cobalamin-dependent protein [Desulforhopalus sp.]
MDLTIAQRSLLEAILVGDQMSAVLQLDRLAEHYQYQRVITEVLEPVLEEIGNRWVAERISLAAGYLAGKIAEDTLKKALACQEVVPGNKGPVVIGNVEDDYHSLGRKMVGIFLQTAGWKVVDLGNDVMAEDFVAAALQHGAPLIGASAMMFTTAMNIKKIRQEIDGRGLKGQIRLAVGGAVFKIRPELVEEVGGEGTAVTAVEAPRLMERLLHEVTG